MSGRYLENCKPFRDFLATVPVCDFEKNVLEIEQQIEGLGVTGPTGPEGVTGPAEGVTGPIGHTGADGEQGITGPSGAMGNAGATGPAGAFAVGDIGATGPDGQMGIQGPTGPAGGYVGNTGATGPQGSLGPEGPTGVMGYSGPQGPTGSSEGDTGAAGPKGPQNGTTGATGSIGNTGEIGNTGFAGHIGDTGPQGVTGQSVAPCIYFNAYDSVGGTGPSRMYPFEGSTGFLVFDTITSVTEGDFTVDETSTILTFNTYGIYEIAYHFAFERTTGAGTPVFKSLMEIDTGLGFSAVPGTEAYLTLEENSSLSTGKISLAKEIQEDTRLRILITKISPDNGNSVTVPGGSSLIINSTCGALGVTGTTGGLGDTGMTGGPTGPAGNLGPTGPSGGDTGDTGPIGPDGEIGPAGIMGNSGSTGYVVQVYKTTSEARASDGTTTNPPTSFAADSALTFSIGANETMLIDGHLDIETNGGADLVVGFDTPLPKNTNRSTLSMTVSTFQNGTAGETDKIIEPVPGGFSDRLNMPGGSNRISAILRGTVFNGPNAGSVMLWWGALAGGNGDTVTVHRGSWLTANVISG